MRLDRDRMRGILKRIGEMGMSEIEEYHRTVSVSSVCSEDRKEIFDACDRRAAEIDRSYAMAVDGDLFDLYGDDGGER